MGKSKTKTIPSISIIAPFYNEEGGVDHFFNAVVAVLEGITQDWEIICVDDGSRDGTLAELKRYHEADPRVKVLSFSRNFGKEAALTSGFDVATKDVVIPLDSDLQDPPHVIEEMVERWRDGYKVVNAVRRSRDESLYKKVPAKIYHMLLHYVTNGKISKDVGDFRLIDQSVLSEVRQLQEKNRYMKGIVSWVGFDTVNVYYDRPGRELGETKFGFFKLLRLGLDGIFSFSSKPLKVWLYLGLVISLISFIYASYLILRTAIYGVDLPGYASIMVSILFMGGIQLIGIGVIGEYIARIFKEVKNRPIYIVEESYGLEEKARQTKQRKKPQTSGLQEAA